MCLPCTWLLCVTASLTPIIIQYVQCLINLRPQPLPNYPSAIRDPALLWPNNIICNWFCVLPCKYLLIRWTTLGSLPFSLAWLTELRPLSNKLLWIRTINYIVLWWWWSSGAQLDYDWLTVRFKGFASLDRFVIVHHHPHLYMDVVDANVQWRRGPPPLQRSQQKSRHIIINHALIECSTRTVTYSNPSVLCIQCNQGNELNPLSEFSSGSFYTRI